MIGRRTQSISNWRSMAESRDLADIGAGWRFGVFQFDALTLELRKNGRIVSVRPQPLKILALLLARPAEVVAREDLQRALWGGNTFVDFEQGVNHAIRELRAALGDTAESPRFIQTLPRRGYRFIAPVERMAAAESVTPSASRETDSAPTSALPERARAPSTAWVARGVTAVVAIVVMSAIGAAYRAARRVDDFAPRPAGLSVVPFNSPGHPSLGVGIARAIAARLGGQPNVPVRADFTTANGRSVQNTLLNRPTHILEGEIRYQGIEVDALVWLRDTAGVKVWSERIQVRANELFSLENVIAERVVAALRLRLAASEQDRLRRRYTSNGEAYAAYIRGLAALVRYTPESTVEAIRAFEDALRHDPSYALARAGLAMSCADMHLRFASAGEVQLWGQRAEAESRAALELDPDLAEAHLARAAVARKREFDWNGTVQAANRALTLNPNLDQAHFFLAAAYYHHGYMEEALTEAHKGRASTAADIVEPIRIEALVALFSGNFVPARSRLEEVSRLSSQPIGDTYLALAYHYIGSTDRARTILLSLTDARSASTAARASAALAGVLAFQHDYGAARFQVERVLKSEYRDHHVAYSLGAAYAQLGDAREAHRWLRIAAETGFPCIPFFERDPLLEPLRNGPEFSELLRYVHARRKLSLPTQNQ